MSAEPSPPGDTVCMPCRGTGEVISNLGGNPHRVTCPWCGGTGMFIPGRDPQNEPAERQAEPAGQTKAESPGPDAADSPAEQR